MEMSLRSSPSRDVIIVDDDPTIHDVLTSAFTNGGMRVVSYADGGSFLAAADMQRPACVLLDVNMPNRSGLDVLKEINARKYPAPILMLSGRKDVPAVVSAIKYGALDFIEKPFLPDAVVNRVQEAITIMNRGPDEWKFGVTRFFGHEMLTPREREVLTYIAGGASNREVGRNLGISIRTVEVHRAHIMEKLCAKNAADLVRIVLSNGHDLDEPAHRRVDRIAVR
jgi:two-component system, LuxR family, response regulator FixJ